MIRAYIGLGSNLNDPRAQIEQAFEELDAIASTELVARSPLYRSAPVGPAGQPDYINACAALDTQLEALALLDALQAIEQAHQRVRLQHWGPRTLDLDLLLYGEQSIHSERLIVPHAYLGERNFVLYPLFDIAADTKLPNGTTIAALKAQLTDEGLVRL